MPPRTQVPNRVPIGVTMPPRQQGKKRGKVGAAPEPAADAAQPNSADGTPTEPEEEAPASPKAGSKRPRGGEAGQSEEAPAGGRHRAGAAARRGKAAAAAAGEETAAGAAIDMEGLTRRPTGAQHKHRAGSTQLGYAMSPSLDGYAEGDSRAYEAVVKVFVIHCEPNFSLPWQRKRQYSSGSSGFIIPGRRILTNAHCVESHTQVKVKRRGSDTKFVASVLAVATEGDMALLTVEDDAFWEGSEPVTFGDLPQLQDPVTVVGYPIGGDTMSVTSGVVSRIEVTSYVHGAAELLGIQIDAAINSGNSGGPAFNLQGMCVGIAFQSLKHEDAENIGYIIPTPVVMHFINDYEKHGKYTGFPCLGVEWQKLENPDLRGALDMRPEQKGVMVRRVEPTAAASQVLSEGDVLTSFDGVPIANDGTVPFRSGERISFSYLISQKYVDEEATLVLLKKGKEHEVRIRLSAPVKLVPYHTKGQPPSYFIIAGLVFTQVTVPYLRSEYGKEYDFDAPVRLLEKMMHGMAESADQQVVVLGQVLAAEVNIGYEDVSNTQVLMLNGQRINNLKDLVAKVDSCTMPYLDFDLDYHQKLVLNTQAAKKATEEILAMHCISQDRSADLLPSGDAAAGPSSPAHSPGNGKPLDRGNQDDSRKQSGRSVKPPGRLNL